MNDIVNYLINAIKFNIPFELLQDVFYVQNNNGMLTTTMEYAIMDKIINGRVLADCNVISGTEVVIDVSGCPRYAADNGTIIDVGTNLTYGRKISSALSVSYAVSVYSSANGSIVGALAPDPTPTTSMVYLIGPNTVLIQGISFVTFTYLRCILELDQGFDGINQRLLMLLSELCIYATKAYIYNEMYLRLGTAVVMYGKDITRYNEIVSGYADAYKMYTDALMSKWRSAYVTSDRVTHNRMIRMLLGGI